MYVSSMIVIGLCVFSLGMTMEINVSGADRIPKSHLYPSYADIATGNAEALLRTVSNHVIVVEGNQINGTIVHPVDGLPEECENGLYTPVSSNCSAFLVCNQGNQTEGYCPPHMWFDPNHAGDMLCNYPEIVCASDNSVCDCAVKYPPLPEDPLIETDVTCLEDNRFHFNSSRVDCGRYFVCFNGNVRRMECKQGFHYDPKTETCDYPEVVNCKIIDPKCPAHGVGFLSHSERRDAFYFCFHGYKTLQQCAFYHVWDEASNSCRRRDEMNVI